MLQFLNPIWFFAAAALLIPVIIHLWNIKPGKVLKVGSTALITAASRKSSRSFKLLDIPLLLLRCLLLLMLALLLAFPVLEQRLKVIKVKGWVMLPKEDFSTGYAKYKTGIDSLLKLGYEFHYFNTGLPKADLTKLLTGKKDITVLDTTLKQPANYWSLLTRVDDQVPAYMPVYLYTTNTIDHFSGDKAAVNLNLHWNTFGGKDSVSTWIQDAWFTDNKAIRVVKGISRSSGTSYQYANIQSDKGNSQFIINVNNGRASVSLAGDKSEPVIVDTSTLKIAIYTDRYQTDAGYLKAALDAAGAFLQRKVVIKQYTNPSLIPANESWIFWLSAQSVPDKFFRQQVNIFAYQAGKQVAITSWLGTNNRFATPAGTVQIPLFKTVNAPGNIAGVLWRDGFGNPMLSNEGRIKANYFQFYTHFNPAWNDMVWDSSFPQIILELISTPADKNSSTHDRRTISAEQIQPVKNNEARVMADKFTVKKELANYFWLALIVVFFAERWLATRTKTIQING